MTESEATKLTAKSVEVAKKWGADLDNLDAKGEKS